VADLWAGGPGTPPPPSHCLRLECMRKKNTGRLGVGWGGGEGRLMGSGMESTMGRGRGGGGRQKTGGQAGAWEGAGVKRDRRLVPHLWIGWGICGTSHGNGAAEDSPPSPRLLTQ